ncbi:hypothetical protein FLAT13_04905 [Flavobacterium salmonis]|uniref:Uncharacterized protein n=1 Tax=Flavobacterium salmonis TaxID=2654844 RepID=A0A6V6ZCX4_9FLAO|nr:hypothetical protein FLAT13_04905 [Flavobacterium salmonis]
MSLGEIYFYTLTGFVSVFSLFIYLAFEDIKLFSIFKKLFLIGLIILIIGFFITLFNLSYLSKSKTIFTYALPLFVLLTNRILFWINNEIFGEPFIYSKNGFLNGFWYHNRVEEEKLTLIKKFYYTYFTFLHLSQIFLYSTLFYKIN